MFHHGREFFVREGSALPELNPLAVCRDKVSELRLGRPRERRRGVGNPGGSEGLEAKEG